MATWGAVHVLQHLISEKNHKIANNLTTTEAKEKIAQIWNP
jgi:hypothetical protein